MTAPGPFPTDHHRVENEQDRLLHHLGKSTEPPLAAVQRVERRVKTSLQATASPWRWWLAPSLAAVAVAVLFLARGPEPALYSVDPLSGGIAQVRGPSEDGPRPDFDDVSQLLWVARPEVDVAVDSGKVQAQVWGRGPDGVWRPLAFDLAPSASGAYVFQGAASKFFGDHIGPWSLVFAIGSRSALAGPPEGWLSHPGAEIQVFRARCRYLGPANDGPPR